jgi:hypothetical protein
MDSAGDECDEVTRGTWKPITWFVYVHRFVRSEGAVSSSDQDKATICTSGIKVSCDDTPLCETDEFGVESE